MNPLLKNLLAGCAIVLAIQNLRATDMYVDSIAGLDSNSGTSAATAKQTFAAANAHTFASGEHLYLAYGASWSTPLVLTGNGGSGTPVTIMPYTVSGRSSTARPVISMSSGTTDWCITIENPGTPNAISHWLISNLELCNAKIGVYFRYHDGSFGNSDLTVTGCYLHDMHIGTGTSAGGIGLLFNGSSNANAMSAPLPSPTQWIVDGVNITKNSFSNVYTPVSIQFNGDTAHGAAAAGYGSGFANQYCFKNVLVWGNSINNAANGSGYRGVNHALFFDNTSYRSSQHDGAVWQGGTTTLYSEFTDTVTFVNNYSRKVLQTGSTDETMFDQEAFNNATNFFSNYTADTAGAGVELLTIYQDGPSTNLPYVTNQLLDGNTFVYNGWDISGGGSLFFSSNMDDPSPPHNQGIRPHATVTNNLVCNPGASWFTVPQGDYTSTTPIPSAGNGSSSIALPGNVINSADNFSAVQGQNHWYYNYTNGTTYAHLPTFTASDAFSGAFSTGSWGGSPGGGGWVNQFDMQPDSNSSYWINREWVAPAAGTISIRGRVLKAVVGGSPLAVRILQRNTSSTTTLMASTVIAANDQSGINTHYDGITVAVGDIICFEVNNDGAASTANQVISWMPTVAYTSGGMSNLLTQDPSFEVSGLPSWLANSATIARTASSHGGVGNTYSCLSTSRTAEWGGPYQDITSVISTNGPGNYVFSGWAKYTAGSDNTFLVLRIKDSTGTYHYFNSESPTVGKYGAVWSYLSSAGCINVSWPAGTTLSEAIIYPDGTSSTNDLYLDDLVLTKQ